MEETSDVVHVFLQESITNIEVVSEHTVGGPVPQILEDSRDGEVGSTGKRTARVGVSASVF